MPFAMIFPGQGSQSVGMLAELAESQRLIKDCFIEASDALDADLWKLSQEGPDEALNRTEWTQPALLAAGVAVWRVWRDQGGPTPDYLAGHSLGEYAALVAAGALDFAEAVRLVQFRGQAMQKAVPEGSGAMAAILGLEDEQVTEVCGKAAEGQVVEPVNFNSPGQVVIAGNKEAVDRAIAEAEAAGAKRAMRLPVSVPSHCRLMGPAVEAMAERLRSVNIQAPKIPVIHNFNVAPEPTPSGIRDALVAQLNHPVRWVETIEAFQERGVESVVEAGPGKVLCGLNRRIDRRMPALPVMDPKTLEKALEQFAS
ncbi:[acyl-carrier-protein] S-malonyltransferase [Natronospira proteinivora]|uniref:Malonyl CoA-acyl carrier protein transacylase n=1 Tax=Natronospira proteinivora TaxID=1807133 RepID=A0ABT1G6D9_9GAMM|nr:ACP S-malonyltransferase [Natronospira proteinivora]MCP1726870.1 [acyl-carrier-protein] S-malonyltransferase [Natronospira proteinivora]